MNIEELIDQKLLANSREPRVRSGKYNPSFLGRCYRAQYWNKLDKPASNPFTVKVLRKFAQGNATHKLWQDLLPQEICEVPIETEYFKGRADIALSSVMDLKGCEQWAFDRYSKIPTELYTEKNRDKFYQAGWYAVQFKLPTFCVIPVVFGTFTHVKHWAETKDWERDIKGETSILISHAVSGELPPPKPRAFGGKECNYCQWHDLCLETEPALAVKE